MGEGTWGCKSPSLSLVSWLSGRVCNRIYIITYFLTTLTSIQPLLECRVRKGINATQNITDNTDQLLYTIK